MGPPLSWPVSVVSVHSVVRPSRVARRGPGNGRVASSQLLLSHRAGECPSGAFIPSRFPSQRRWIPPWSLRAPRCWVVTLCRSRRLARERSTEACYARTRAKHRALKFLSGPPQAGTCRIIPARAAIRGARVRGGRIVQGSEFRLPPREGVGVRRRGSGGLQVHALFAAVAL